MKVLAVAAALATGIVFAAGLAPAAPRDGIAASAPASAPSTVAVDVPLEVRETAGVARENEIVRSGIPLPRTLDLPAADGLVVVDASGRALPTEIEVLSRWPVPEGVGPVHWVLLTFPASVGAGESGRYRLVDASSLAKPASQAAGPALRIERDGGAIVVDTGAAVFRLGGGGTLFEEVALADGDVLARGEPIEVEVEGRRVEETSRRRFEIEREGRLAGTVVEEAVLGLPPVGDGAVSAWRRYAFAAGSPTAIVRQAVTWEGSLGPAGRRAHDGRPNALLATGIHDRLRLAGGPVGASRVAAERGGPTLRSASAPAFVRQRQRARRQDPRRYEARAGEAAASGEEADRAWIAAVGERGSLGVALRDMHRYEPQSLRVDETGATLDLLDGRAWIANHQSLFATLAVTALPGDPAAATWERELWAPLARPLRAWPEADWLARHQPVPEVPFGPLPPSLRAYDEIVPAVLHRTLAGVDEAGLAGIMTFGVYPRYWGRWDSPELECRHDPTPDDAWDRAYWCGTWTDYHHTVATAATWAMRTGDFTWFDEIALPAALRTLHTQIMQCAPDDDWFYCGQAPTGYGAYRSDFNSSHAYFQNLFDAYLLTGDRTVLRTLSRGAANHERWMREKHDVALRAPSQWIRVARFLGRTGDPRFERLFRWAVETAVDEHYAELERGGETYGFWSKEPLGGPGTYTFDNLYAPAFYDFDNLWWYLQDTGDAPIGARGVRPSRALVALARTYADVAARLEGAKGGIDGTWPRALRFTIGEGPDRARGNAVKARSGKPAHLFSGDKPAMAAFLTRAACLSGDPALERLADDVLRYALDHARGEAAPLGKLMGLGLTRVHPAVALEVDPEACRKGGA